MKIAFLGLGAMGSRMAPHIAEGGHDVVVWNRSPTRAAALGLPMADTPADAARTADIVIAMVTDDRASTTVWLGQDGALAGMRPGALAVEMSTVSPDQIEKLATAAAARNIDLLDAPVAGSRPQAEAQALSILVGGTDAGFGTFEPVAKTMGKAVVHVGEQGQGIALKMLVNAMLALQTAGLADILKVGETLGLDKARAMDLLEPTPILSPAAAFVGRQIASGSHDPMFTVDLLSKDLSYTLDGQDAPVLSAVADAFHRAQANGHGDRHITAVALS